MQQSRKAAALGGLLLLLATVPALPQQPTQTQTDAIRQSCRSDFRANCSSVQPGGKDALDCLKQNVAKLSPPCKTAVSAIMPAPPLAAPPAPAAAAPPPPAPVPPPTPAADVTPPPATLETHPAANASPPPHHAAAAPTQAQTTAIRQSCRADFTANCAGVTPGGADALKCLQSHVARLSPDCKAAVAATQPAHPPKPQATPAAAVAVPMPIVPPPPAAMAPPPPPPPTRVTPIDLAVMVRDCKLDLIRYCTGVQPGGGREVACLTAHTDGLTFRCRTALKVTAPLR